MPGTRKMNTGVSLKKPARMAPRRDCCWFLPASTRWTMYWSVHQYQKPMIIDPGITAAHDHSRIVDGADEMDIVARRRQPWHASRRADRRGPARASPK